MNREQRRKQNQMKRSIDKQNKKLREHTLVSLIEGPCAYVDNKPVHVGDCVFLKHDNEIQGQYDWTLNKLIDKNHRFVILNHQGLKKGILAVGLLSTSSYLNEENRLGIRLKGKYHKNKYVYMDAKNLWIIKSDCIKSIDYSLNETDMSRCMAVVKTNNTGCVAARKGLINDDVVNKYISFYEKAVQHKLNKSDQVELNCLDISDFVRGLSLPEVMHVINTYRDNEPELYKGVDVCIKEDPSISKELNEEAYYKTFLTMLLTLSDSMGITSLSKELQIGYE